MTNMNVYWNEDYCGTKIDFATFKKSKYIAFVLNNYAPMAKCLNNYGVSVKDPADRVGMLAEAQLVLQQGLDPKYLQAVMTGRPRELAESNGFSWDMGVYQTVLNSTAGILCAIRDVARGGFHYACSLSSGLHHARRSRGAGFCTVNSLALGAMYARKMFEKVLILDLDAHCGGGTNEYLQNTDIVQVDYSTSDFDSYAPNGNSNLLICKNKDEYLDFGLAETLSLVEKIEPDVVIYNAGVDIYPFVAPETVVKREIIVADFLRNLGTPTVIVIAGGYGDYGVLTQLHLATIMAFATPDLLTESPRVSAGRPSAGQFAPFVGLL